MVYNLTNRNVLVTGGSRGLGAVTVERFAKEGANIVVNYLSSKEAAEELVLRIKSTYGVRAVAIGADVGIETECRRLVVETIAALGGLDVIISNAGWTRFSPFSDLNGLSSADWDRCYAVNVKATMFLVQSAEATFRSNSEGGVVLVTSSCAATNAAGSSIAYAVSKAAGLHLVQCLATATGEWGVRVNAVLPGLLLTEWGLGFGEEVIKGAVAKARLKRLGTVEDCAEAFVYLAKADTVTGASLRVDGGQFER